MKARCGGPAACLVCQEDLERLGRMSEKPKQKRILVVAAHHDDETLGCGATMARLASQGHEVNVLVLGEGPSARDGMGDTYKDAIWHSVEAIKSLGGILYVNGVCGFPDNRFDTVPLLDVVKHIESMLKDLPDVVYTHHGGDLNIDHRIVHEATKTATRLYGPYPVKELYAYEVLGSTDCILRREDAFVPTVYQEITQEQLGKKIQAMEMYETERRAFPHPRSPEALRAQATYRGAQAGLMAAEAFQLVRGIR